MMDCLITQAAGRFGQYPALIDQSRVISFSEYDRLVGIASANLLNQGISEGTRVGIMLPNTIDYAIILFALIRVKAIACPISTRLPDGGVDNCLNKAGCQFLITKNPLLLNSLCQLIRPEEIFEKVTKPTLSCATIRMEQPATIIFTSGSTGEPKAVLLSLGNHFFNAHGSNENIKFQPEDRWFLSLPLYHVGGIGILFRSILSGGAVVFPDPEKDVESQILTHKITHLSMVSTQLRRFISSLKSNKDLSKSMKAILLGGSAFSSSLISASFNYGLPIHTSYGLTEMASQVTTTQPSASLSVLLTSGKVLPHRDVRISPTGEIQVDGKTRFEGYVDKEALLLPFDKDGWFSTGDIGYFDPNENLILNGRMDTMFISGGENIYPEEIENALYQIDAVEAAVVIPIQDDEFGFRPVAFIKIDQGRALDAIKIKKELEGKLPHFKIPDRFFPWPDDLIVGMLKPDRRFFRNLAESIRNKNH